MDTIRLTIDSRPGQVALAGRCIRALSAALGGERAGFEIELAACEAINNVIEHAYDRLGGRQIVVEWTHHDDDLLQIDIHDWGRCAPPMALQASLPEVNQDDICNLPEGGFGIGLLNALTDRVDYRSDADGRNTLSLFRRLKDGPGGAPA